MNTTSYESPSDTQVHEIASAYYAERRPKTQAQEHPALVLVGGQPGAGKSAASSLVRAELATRGGFIHIDADRMREEIPIGNAKPPSEQTQPDAHRLVTALRGMAVADRRNILEEGTFRNADAVKDFANGMKARGYAVEMLVVATPREQSLLGIYTRFEDQHESGANNPRILSEQYHDEAFKGFENTLAKVGPMFDRTRVIDRAGAVLFDSRGSQQGNALEALADGRKLTDAKLQDVAARWPEQRNRAEQRNAPARYQATLENHENRIIALQKDRIHGHAMKQLDANLAILGKDQRFARHTNQELLKAAYFRGFHEAAAPLKGQSVNFKLYDEHMATRSTLTRLPDITDLEEMQVAEAQRQHRAQDGHSL